MDDDDKGDDDDNGMGIAHLADIDIQFGEECPMLTLQEQTCGDVLRHNHVLLWCDLLHYWEMKQCAKEGDVGHLFEMNKVSRHTSYIIIANQIGSSFISGSLASVQVTMGMSYCTRCLISGSTSHW